MSGFTAAEVSSLTFDFTPWDGPKGIIPEPSEADSTAFFKAIAEQRKQLREDPDNFEGDAWCDAVETLGKGSPSADVLRALPSRIRTAFLRWLIQELTDPKA